MRILFEYPKTYREVNNNVLSFIDLFYKTIAIESLVKVKCKECDHVCLLKKTAWTYALRGQQSDKPKPWENGGEGWKSY